MQIIDRQIIGGFFLFFVLFVSDLLVYLACHVNYQCIYWIAEQNHGNGKVFLEKRTANWEKETTSPTRKLFNLLLVSTSKKSIIM